MPKTKLAILAIALIALAITFNNPVQAQENNALPKPGLVPSNPFYFFDTLGEKISLFFTFGAEKKAQKALSYAGEKLAEAKLLVEKGQSGTALKKALLRHKDYLATALKKAEQAKEQGKDVEELMTLISEATLKHQAVLLEVYKRVPEQAKEAIQNALEKSLKGYKEALEAVSSKKKQKIEEKSEEIQEKIKERIKNLKLKKAIEKIKDDFTENNQAEDAGSKNKEKNNMDKGEDDSDNSDNSDQEDVINDNDDNEDNGDEDNEIDVTERDNSDNRVKGD